jgi:hypothetical protein
MCTIPQGIQIQPISVLISDVKYKASWKTANGIIAAIWCPSQVEQSGIETDDSGDFMEAVFR